MHWQQSCILTDRITALEDQMLARLSCKKALFAAAMLCVILGTFYSGHAVCDLRGSASKVQSEVKTLPSFAEHGTSLCQTCIQTSECPWAN